MRAIFNMKSYFTFLSRNKVYTLINVFGLSISLMFVILIAIYTTQEYSIDRMHSKAERIYALGCEMNINGMEETIEGSHWKIQRYLKDRYPEIEKSCAMSGETATVVLPSEEEIDAKMLFTDSTFYQIFDFELITGDRNHLLDATNSAVLTEGYAKKIFGDSDPIGKDITVRNDSHTFHLIVTGIAKEMKGSCIENYDVIARYEQMQYFNYANVDDKMSNIFGASLIMLTKPGSDLTTKAADMTKYFSGFYNIYHMPGVKAKALVIPFNELYFSETDSNSECTARGDRTLVNILFVVGLVILLFSVINYINLTVAQAGRRAKEMATRRLMGSQRSEIVARLMAESIALCFLSLLIGILLAWLAAPYADSLLDTNLDLGQLLHIDRILLLLLFVVVIGIAAGIVPATIISRTKPIEIVRGTLLRNTKMFFSKILIVVQCTVTIVMIAVSLTMVMQVRHLVNAPLGYNRDNIIVIDNTSSDSTKVEAFRNELLQQADIKNVSLCSGYPLNTGSNNTIVYKGKTVALQFFFGDEQFLKLFGIQIDKDYNNPDEDGFYINRQTCKELEMDDQTRRVDIAEYDNPSIRGIVKDFHIGNIMDEQHPVLINIRKKITQPWSYAIQVTGDPVKAYRNVQEVYKSIFKRELDVEQPFIDQKIQQMFDGQIRMSKIITLFAAIAILISFLGLLAMSTYFIQQRDKEIAIRKVFGSTNRQMLTKLIGTFMLYVGIAFLISLPISRYLTGRWIADYSYRIALSPWIFIAAGLFCAVISVAAVFVQSYIAANENPIHHIKDNQ